MADEHAANTSQNVAQAGPEHGAGEGTTASSTASPTEPPFTREELAQFDADDGRAGSVIGRMLALFFFYTVVVMSFVTYWTLRALSQ